MSWLWAIIVGLVLGVIARAILPGKQDIPLWLTAVFGILGSILGNAVVEAGSVWRTPRASTGSAICCNWRAPWPSSPSATWPGSPSAAAVDNEPDLAGSHSAAAGHAFLACPAAALCCVGGQPTGPTSTAARFFLPRRSTSQRPCSSSPADGATSPSTTFTLFT